MSIVVEDWSRALEMEQMYIIEGHMRMEQEWQEWEEEQERLDKLPAIIELVTNLKPIEK